MREVDADRVLEVRMGACGMFVTPSGQRIDVAQSRKRIPKPPPSLLDPELRRKRTLLIGLAKRARFATADLAEILGITERHVRRSAATFDRVSARLSREATDAE